MKTFCIQTIINIFNIFKYFYIFKVIASILLKNKYRRSKSQINIENEVNILIMINIDPHINTQEINKKNNH